MDSGGLFANPRARFTGAVYLAYLAAIELAWIMADQNVGATNIALLASSLCYLLLSLLFYRLLRPVSRRVALEALLFGVAGSILGILHVCGIASQIRSIAFLGGFLLLTGYLMFRATFLPRFLGALMVLCGCGWLVYLVPLVARRTHGYLSRVSLVMEGVVALWLLVKGVDEGRWREQAENQFAAVGHSTQDTGACAGKTADHFVVTRILVSLKPRGCSRWSQARFNTVMARSISADYFR